MMLKLPSLSWSLASLPCNAATLDINSPKALIKKQRRFFGSASPRLKISISQHNAVVSGEKYSSASSSALIVTEAKEKEDGSGGSEKSLGDRLRLGSLTEDGLSYKEKFIVRCYEVGINKTATVETIAKLLQEVGCNHFRILGFSTGGFATTTTVRKSNLTWVIARMHIDIYKYPAWSDVVEIETWYEFRSPIWGGRYWILKDSATSEIIGRATSKWVIMNPDTRRLEKISDDALEEYLAFSPRESRLAFPEEKNGSLMKIAKLENHAEYSRQGLMPTRADLDMNQHVNNVTHISWVLEGMPQEIIDTHEIKAITLDYTRECRPGDVVDSLTSSEPFEDTQVSEEHNGSNGLAAATTKGSEEFRQFLHLLRLSGDGHEISRGRTKWKKKQNKIYPNHSV